MAHIFIQGNPLLKNDDLGLKSKFGLRYVFPEMPMMSVFEDGTTLGMYRDRERTVADIAKFSTKDAEAFRKLADMAHVTTKSGRATGVATADGREYTAKDGVIGAIHPHLLGKMVAGLDPVVVRAAEATQISEIGCFTIHAALNAPLKFRAGDHVK